jgi:ABC-type dipeptide/oligopeptide/nickel transport system permease component
VLIALLTAVSGLLIDVLIRAVDPRQRIARASDS